MSLRVEGMPMVPTGAALRVESPSGPESSAGGASGGSFQDFLRGLGPRLDAGEALMGRTLGADLGSLEAPRMIAIQAGIYRYTEVLDLTGKVLDRATNAVRTVLQPGGH